MKKLLLALVCFVHGAVSAQTTMFTYQGRLTENGAAANSTNDFRFRLYSDAIGNNQIGANAFSDDVIVSNGLFTTTIDFGSSAFDGADRWLEISVRPGASTGTYTALTPLQKVSSTPYAIQSVKAATATTVTGNISDSQLSANVARLNTAQTFSGNVSFNNASGNFSGNGAGLTNVNAATLNGLASSNFWKTGGNAGTTGGAHFIGTTDNQPFELKVNDGRALRLEPTTNGAPNVVAGAAINQIDAGVSGSTIAGGGVLNYFGSAYSNRVSSDFSFIGGGRDNSIQAGSLQSVIGGGSAHAIRTNSGGSTIGGGYFNVVDSGAGISTISGGGNNLVQSSWSTIAGGDHNTVGKFANQSAIGGGSGNTIELNDTYSVIGGGYGNLIRSNASESVIDGGYYNTIEPDSVRSAVGGGYFNRIATNSPYSVIGGGNQNSITNSIQATIGGGSLNIIQTNSQGATIAGGMNNKILTNSGGAMIGGGVNNSLNGAYGTVAGGANNSVQSVLSAVVGGDHNDIWPGALNSFIGGGRYNVILSNSPQAVIAGGYGHYINPNSDEATIAGGYGNIVFSGGTRSAIGGGYGNYSTGPYATLPGGDQNTATTNSLAAGHRAKANHKGSFVWADSQDVDFVSTATNQFLIRATNGVGINKNNPATALDVNGTVSATSFSANGSTVWNAGNDGTGSGLDADFLDGIGSTSFLRSDTSATFSGSALTLNTSAGADAILVESGLDRPSASLQTFNFLNSGVGTMSLLVDGNTVWHAGNDGGGSGLNADFLDGQDSSSFWKTGGNSGTTPGTDFIGTTDNQALEFKVNGQRAFRLEPSTLSLAPNVIGGASNSISPSAYGGAIGGGVDNTIQTNAYESAIGGGNANIIQTAAWGSVIGGGDQNTIQTNADRSTITGGYLNMIQTNAYGGAIGGGRLNVIQTGSYNGTIAGGSGNSVGATSPFAVIGGGFVNYIQSNAMEATIAGGFFNTNIGPRAAIPGGDQNVAGTNSFAAGHRAKATHTGSFVWADLQETDFSTTATNQFLIRANGGVGINKNNPAVALDVSGDIAAGTPNQMALTLTSSNTGGTWANIVNTSSGGRYWNIISTGSGNGEGAGKLLLRDTTQGVVMTLSTNGNVGIGTSSPTNKLHVAGGVSATVFVTTSDRNAKENFTNADSRSVLEKVAALPIAQWNFKEMPGVPHMGPTAQDFYAAFGLGGSDTGIATVDADGVALAAIQGLNQKVEEKDARIRELQEKAGSLEKRVAELERLLTTLAGQRAQ